MTAKMKFKMHLVFLDGKFTAKYYLADDVFHREVQLRIQSKEGEASIEFQRRADNILELMNDNTDLF